MYVASHFYGETEKEILKYLLHGIYVTNDLSQSYSKFWVCTLISGCIA